MNQINQDYDEIIKTHPQEMKDAILYMEKEMVRRHVKFGEERLNAFLKPFFISPLRAPTISASLASASMRMHAQTI